MPGSKNIILRGYQLLSISYSSQKAKNTPRRVKILPGEYFSGLSLWVKPLHLIEGFLIWIFIHEGGQNLSAQS